MVILNGVVFGVLLEYGFFVFVGVVLLMNFSNFLCDFFVGGVDDWKF